jgi:hypothetical protein
LAYALGHGIALHGRTVAPGPRFLCLKLPDCRFPPPRLSRSMRLIGSNYGIAYKPDTA